MTNEAQSLRQAQIMLNTQADEITRLRAAIKQAIRQHEEGNKGLSHRTLCEAIYGPQA